MPGNTAFAKPPPTTNEWSVNFEALGTLNSKNLRRAEVFGRALGFPRKQGQSYLPFSVHQTTLLVVEFWQSEILR